MFQPCYLHSWKYYEISNEEYDTVTRIPGSRVHLNGECHLQRKYTKELRRSKHTFLYLDQDLNDVSQDGRVFEASVRVDRETTEAVPGRNSRKQPPVTFRRPTIDVSESRPLKTVVRGRPRSRTPRN